MAHGTNCPILHIIIIIIIHIIHIIFLFHTASANLIVYFPLKPMGVCFLHCWPASPRFQSFVLQPVCELQPIVLSFLPKLIITKPYKCVQNSPLKSVYCIINYPTLLNISAGIPLAY